jgi:hypothetical protein
MSENKKSALEVKIESIVVQDIETAMYNLAEVYEELKSIERQIAYAREKLVKKSAYLIPYAHDNSGYDLIKQLKKETPNV